MKKLRLEEAEKLAKKAFQDVASKYVLPKEWDGCVSGGGTKIWDIFQFILYYSPADRDDDGSKGLHNELCRPFPEEIAEIFVNSITEEVEVQLKSPRWDSLERKE